MSEILNGMKVIVKDYYISILNGLIGVVAIIDKDQVLIDFSNYIMQFERDEHLRSFSSKLHKGKFNLRNKGLSNNTGWWIPINNLIQFTKINRNKDFKFIVNKE